MVPLPYWWQLFKSLWPCNLNDQMLAQPWIKKDEHAFFFSRSAWSIQAIVYWWETILDRSHPTVWIPDYFCNQSLIPLRRTSANILFYPIDFDLNPNWEFCTRLAQNAPPDIFLLVHYFGKQANAKLAKQFCKNHHALLIEDAAHVLQPLSGIGDHGEFVLYSPHKLLAIPDGALCLMRNSSYHYVEKSKEHAIDIMNSVQQKMGTQQLFPFKWLIKRLIQKTIPHFLYRKKTHDFHHQSVESSLGVSAQSNYSKKLLKTNLRQLNDIAEKRKNHEAAWQFILAQHQDIDLFHAESVNPYLAIFQGTDANKLQFVYSELQKQNWPVSTWPDLPPEINDKNDSLPAQTLRNTLFTLPVHHSLTLHQLTKDYYFKQKKTFNDHYQIQYDVSQAEWELFFNQVKQSNLLQSWNYGEAKNRTEGFHVQRVLIKKNNVVIGLCQLLQKSISMLGSIVRINRGPIWLDGPESADDLFMVYQLIAKIHGLKKRKILLIAPELTEMVQNKIILHAAGYKSRRAFAWQSSWVDLSQSIETLRNLLDGKWRNQLKLAEKENLIYQISTSEKHFSDLLSQYVEFQEKKCFSGIPVSLLKTLYESDLHHENVFIVQITQNEVVIAGAIIIRHGNACTYTVGWTSEMGRKKCAMNFLLWNVLITIKEKGVHWFDLGGFDDKNNPSIAKFKRGLKGSDYSLVGEYYL